jgi:hypothetical protein
MDGVFGMKFPSWLKWGLAFAAQRGMITRMLQLGLTLATPFLIKKELPILGRLLAKLQSSES